MLAEGPVAFYMDGHPSTGEDHVPIYRHAAVPPIEVDGLDALLLSHLHSDHFDAAARERGRPVIIYTDLPAGANLSIIQLAEIKLTQ